MGRVHSSLTTSVLMRVDKSSRIQDSYANKYVEFSCPANWLDYSINKNNSSVGDLFECVFARIRKDDPRIYMMTDIKGKPMRDHLLIVQDVDPALCLLRYIPVILTPTLCMYSFNIQRTLDSVNTSTNRFNNFIFDLDGYRNEMGYSSDEASALIILDTASFFKDLRESIPEEIEKNKGLLTSERFYGEFRRDEPLIFKDMNYHRHSGNELFFDEPNIYEDLFWKLPEYEYQSEARISIPNINFKQTYNPRASTYNHKINKLIVHLPHLHEYARACLIKDIPSLIFCSNNDEQNTFRMGALKLNFNEAISNMEKNNGTLIV